jgi:hypothetical protein
VTDPTVSANRQGPKRPPAFLADITLLVRVPGRPDLIRAYTSAERADAEAYAAATGGAIDQLPHRPSERGAPA